MNLLPSEIAHRFLDAISAGNLPSELLTEDMSAWGTMQGPIDREHYCGMVRSLTRAVAEPIVFTVDAVTAEGERIVIEARSHARLVTGDTYENTYVFVLQMAGDRIAHVAEHFNPLVVLEKLMPAMNGQADA